MRIALTGVSGLVGHDLYQHLQRQGHQVWALGRTHAADVVAVKFWCPLDITDAQATQDIVAKINPDCLIHSAAMSNPDDCQLDPDQAYRVNALATRNLAMACQRFDTEMVYISSDQVFDGKKKSPYWEMDAVSSVNHYGQSKIWAEHFVQTLLRRFYIVRTSLVFGLKRATFIDKVIRAAQQHQTITATVDMINSCTHVSDLSKALGHLIQSHVYGTYHIAARGHCSRYELACFTAEMLGIKNDFIIKGFAQDLKLPAPRPGSTPLECKVWQLNNFPPLNTWQQSVAQYVADYPLI